MNQVNNTTPFQFTSVRSLTEHTGFTASNLHEFVEKVKIVPESCIFHHFHRSFLQHNFLAADYSNDFSYWTREVLQIIPLAEKLGNIDAMQFASIEELRQAILTICEPYAEQEKELSFVPPEKKFHFLSSRNFEYPTSFSAHNLETFMECLSKVSQNSIYYHFFIAHMRIGTHINDFSMWISTSLHNEELASKISRLNPQMYSLETLRSKILKYCKEYK